MRLNDSIAKTEINRARGGGRTQLSELAEVPVGDRSTYADHDENLDGDADDEFPVCVIVIHVSVLLCSVGHLSIRLHGPGFNC